MAALPFATWARERRHNRQRRLVLKSLADRLGLVTFGSVDQHRDEHEVIRGVTISNTHDDRQYAVGSHDGYDISVVDRRDHIGLVSGKKVDRRWCIIQVSLRDTPQHPHVFMMPSQREPHFDTFFTATWNLKPLDVMQDVSQTIEFARRYRLYTTPRDVTRIDELTFPGFYELFSVRLWPHAVEVFDGKVLVYITENRLDETVLESAVQSALWLADQIDTRSA